MITGRQIREARKLLQWNRAALSGMAELPVEIVARAERTDGIPSITLAQGRKLEAICEAAGVHFHPNGSVTLKAENDRQKTDSERRS
jgi:ribosome-binding protein aMBF1 (putative translation factor)